ncbi:MAG: imidazole glycerol phosphate synthase subunit HisH [Pseudomonadota bacterium]|jgi:glutamine amidotransferase
MSVVIVDNGGANVASLRYALERLGTTALLSADPDCIRAASRVILPGVGAAADAMARLKRHGLDAVLPRLMQPVLGICLGMQLLHEHCEEGDVQGLGILPGVVRRLRLPACLPVPHMGWNQLAINTPHALLDGLGTGPHLYFVHSYALCPGSATIAQTDYGVPIAAVVSRANFHGVQFHPERSAAAGARLLANFLALEQ